MLSEDPSIRAVTNKKKMAGEQGFSGGALAEHQKV
jgi:hypothetical protein